MLRGEIDHHPGNARSPLMKGTQLIQTFDAHWTTNSLLPLECVCLKMIHDALRDKRCPSRYTSSSDRMTERKLVECTCLNTRTRKIHLYAHTYSLIVLMAAAKAEERGHLSMGSLYVCMEIHRWHFCVEAKRYQWLVITLFMPFLPTQFAKKRVWSLRNTCWEMRTSRIIQS